MRGDRRCDRCSSPVPAPRLAAAAEPAQLRCQGLDPDRPQGRLGSGRQGAQQAAADRQHDEADDGLPGAPRAEAEPDGDGAGIPAEQPGRDRAGPRAGERMRVRDLLYALLLPSASDAAETLAVGVSGSVPAFVADMNRAARQLGLSDTSYANPIGLDDPDNYSSAHDLVTLASILMRNPLFARIVEHAERDAPQRRPSADGHQPEHAAGTCSLDQRRQDRAHPRRRLRAGRLRAHRGSTTLISAVLGTPSESRRDAEHARAPRVRLLALPPGAAGEPSGRGGRLSQARLPQRPPAPGRPAAP